jgi:hypothetical protein
MKFLHACLLDYAEAEKLREECGHYTFPGCDTPWLAEDFFEGTDKINKTARISRPLSGAIAVNHKLQERASQVT